MVLANVLRFVSFVCVLGGLFFFFLAQTFGKPLKQGIFYLIFIHVACTLSQTDAFSQF